MLDNDCLNNMVLDISKDIMDISVNLQVIFQLLVKKGIVTRKEVQEMRNIVRSEDPYKQMGAAIDKIQDENKKQEEFDNPSTKRLNKTIMKAERKAFLKYMESDMIE